MDRRHAASRNDARPLILTGGLFTVEFTEKSDEGDRLSLPAESLRAYKECYDDSPLAFCIIEVLKDELGKVFDLAFVYLNKALADLEGKRIEDLWGKHFYQIFEDTDAKWLDFYGRVAYGGKSNNFTEYSPEIKKYLNIQCYQIQEGRCGCLLTDVTKSKELEALVETQIKYSFAVSAADLAMWEYDIKNDRLTVPYGHSGRITMERYCLSGHVIENFSHSICEHSSIIMNKNDLSPIFREIHDGQPVVTGEIWYADGTDGTPRCDKISYSVTCGTDGRPVRAYGIGLEITPLKINEKRYRCKLAALTDASGACCSFRCNLTKNLCVSARDGLGCFKNKAYKTADELLCAVAGLVADPALRGKFSAVFGRKELLASFENGVDSLSSKLKLNANGVELDAAVCADMLQDPRTGSTEAIVRIIVPLSQTAVR